MVERGGQVGRNECTGSEGLARVVIPGEGGVGRHGGKAQRLPAQTEQPLRVIPEAPRGSLWPGAVPQHQREWEGAPEMRKAGKEVTKGLSLWAFKAIPKTPVFPEPKASQIIEDTNTGHEVVSWLCGVTRSVRNDTG